MRDTLATKEDILNLGLAMQKGFRKNIRWVIGSVLLATGLILAVIKIH